MKTSEAGLALIRTYEGLRLEAYPDPGTGKEPYTLGFGHTQGVKLGDICTEEQANAWLREDVKRAESCINASVTVPLTQPEFDSLVSFVFNVGCQAFRDSTLRRLLNDSDFDGASEHLLRWVYAGGKKMDGLVARRTAECKLFETSIT